MSNPEGPKEQAHVPKASTPEKGFQIALQSGEGKINTKNITPDKPLVATDFIKDRQEAVEKLKQTMTPQQAQLSELMKKKATLDAALKTPGGDGKVAPASAEQQQALAAMEKEIGELKTTMQQELQGFVGDEFYVLNQEVQGEKKFENVVYIAEQGINKEGASETKYRVVSRQKEFESIFIQPLLTGLDKELAINTADIISGFKEQEAALAGEIQPAEQGFLEKWLGIPAGVGVLSYIGDKFLGTVTGDVATQEASKGFFAGVLEKGSKLVDGIFGTAEKVVGNDPKTKGSLEAAKSAGVGIIGFLNGFFPSEAVTKRVDANGGGSSFSLFGYNGPKEKLDAPTNNEFCGESLSDQDVYDRYCASYSSIDTSGSLKTIAGAHNNPGNIKYTPQIKAFMDALGKPCSAGEVASKDGDGSTYAKFANMGDGLYAMMTLVRKNYKNYTLGHGLKLYAAGTYDEKKIIKELPTPPEVKADMTYKELTDTQFVALITAQRKYEDNQSYAAMSGGAAPMSEPVADEGDKEEVVVRT